MIATCLLFDRAHADEGWLCCRSIRQHEPSAVIYVLCLDETVEREATDKNVIAVPLEALEERYPLLEAVRAGRPWPAYTQTCKVFLPSHIFDVFGEDALCYVDSDMYFWGSVVEIEKAMAGMSFIVASREDLVRPPQGEFNGGFFACRNDEQARTFLSWWQERTLDWCEWRPGSGGRFTEEGYLNVLADEPGRFPGAGRCPHPGINLARWNARRHDLEVKSGGVVIDGCWPLICFHYQGFDMSRQAFGLGAQPENAIRFIYEHYGNELKGARGRR